MSYHMEDENFPDNQGSLEEVHLHLNVPVVQMGVQEGHLDVRMVHLEVRAVHLNVLAAHLDVLMAHLDVQMIQRDHSNDQEVRQGALEEH